LRIPASVRDRLAAGDGLGAPSRKFAVLAWIAWAALVVALAGPRMVAATPALPASGRDIMLALDLSGSMAIRDFSVDGRKASRIDALKRVGSELIRRRAGDRIGLVIFAEHAFAAAPLSFDVAAVSRTLEEVAIGLVGRSTAIGDGLGLALKRLADSKAPSRIIILLSDGSNNAGSTDPMGVARLAKARGVRLYTIGLGVNDTSAPNDDPDPVDFVTLQRLAEIGGGQAFRVRTTEDLAAAARAIEDLVAGEIPAPPAIVRRELWTWPATLAFLASLGLVMSRRRWS
jgi:Ca-activated chloride channel family protein